MTALPEPAMIFSALLHVGRRVRSAETAIQLAFIVVNESLQVLPYRQSALWIRHKGVVAVSGLPETDRDAPYIQWLQALFSALPPNQTDPISLSIDCLPDNISTEIAADWNDWLPEHALLFPMRGPGNENLGYWLLADASPWSNDEQAVGVELADIYAHAWRGFHVPLNWRQRLLSSLKKGNRRRNLAIAALLLMLFPVRLTVMIPAEVSPKDAYPVRAPLEGAIDTVYVRPNETVAVNQALFDLDTTGLRTRLSVARKAFEAAAEEYRQAAQLAVSDDEKGRLEMTLRKGRMEEKAAELDHSQTMLDRVQVKASRAGVAVFSDAADWVGKAVMIGERVMQIADPGQVEITLRLPVGDAIPLDPTAKVTLYLSNAPQFSYAAKLTYMAYRAEPGADGIVAYRMKADFEPDETLPRLGLTGTARVYGDRVPFIYYLLRRPIGVLRQWVGF